MTMDNHDIVLVGHPYAPIGCGESLRCSYRALRSAAMRPGLLDVYGMNTPEADAAREFGGAMTKKLGRINVFHLNADEVDASLATLPASDLARSYNILYPNWSCRAFRPSGFPCSSVSTRYGRRRSSSPTRSRAISPSRSVTFR